MNWKLYTGLAIWMMFCLFFLASKLNQLYHRRLSSLAPYRRLPSFRTPWWICSGNLPRRSHYSPVRNSSRVRSPMTNTFWSLNCSIRENRRGAIGSIWSRMKSWVIEMLLLFLGCRFWRWGAWLRLNYITLGLFTDIGIILKINLS